MQKDVQNVQVEINGYGHTYNYDRKETLEKQNNEDAFNVGVKLEVNILKDMNCLYMNQIVTIEMKKIQVKN